MQIIINPKFPLGQVVITAKAQDRLSQIDTAGALQRHAFEDWGDLCPEDAA